MEYYLKHYRILHTTMTSDKEIPKRSNILQIKLQTCSKEQNKAPMLLPRFEGKHGVSSNDLADTCTEEFVEDSSTSKTKEIDKHAYGSNGSIYSKYEHICKICNKVFESERALSGHKRIHSDKVVKKEVPHKAHNGSQVPANPTDEDLDWKSNCKRPQKRKCADDNNDAMISAAENLLYFSSIIHMEAENTKHVPTKATELQLGGDPANVLETDRNSTNLNPVLHEKASETMLGEEDGFTVALNTEEFQSSEDQTTIQFKEILESDLRLSVGDDEKIIEISSTQNALELASYVKENIGTSGNQKKEKKVLGNDLSLGILSEKAKRKRIKLESDPVDAARVYVCRICNKSFPSHQALGGHTVSHNHQKTNKGEVGHTTKASKTSEHKCKKCGKVYETGQSLGGHMRKHYDPDKSKSLDTTLTLRTTEEGNRNGSYESSSAISMEETEHSPIINDDISKNVSGESSSANIMEETSETQSTEEDTSNIGV